MGWLAALVDGVFLSSVRSSKRSCFHEVSARDLAGDGVCFLCGAFDGECCSGLCGLQRRRLCCAVGTGRWQGPGEAFSAAVFRAALSIVAAVVLCWLVSVGGLGDG